MRQLVRLVTFLGLGWVGCYGATKSNPAPDVILVTLDTTRADRMGFMGSQRGLTPNLDELAKQGVVFTRAYAQVPLTNPSHTTILTGTYPQFHQVNDFGIPLSPKVPYLPDLLRGHGYKTAAFVGGLVLDPVFGSAPGMERGFDNYDAGFHTRRPRDDRYLTIERRGGEVVRRALDWLDHHPGGPIFLWVHLYDAHDPYDPPEPYKTRYAAEPYDGEIAYADAAVGKLVAGLRVRKRFDRTVIAVMADHGEALGEHGEQTHGIFLYDETLHVPLLFKLPGGLGAGKRVEARVELVDVAPTLLREAELPVPEAIQGRSLAAMMTPSSTAENADHTVYAESDYPHTAFGWSRLQAWRSGKYLYVKAPEPELYDQMADPATAKNIAGQSSAVAETLAGQLQQFYARTAESATTAIRADPERARKLAALGYVSSDPGDLDPKLPSANADPKGRIEIANLMHAAIFEVEGGSYADAIPKLERVLALQPEMAMAESQLGIAQSRLQNYNKAVPLLEKTVRRHPESALNHYELGLAFFGTGDWKAGAAEFEAAVGISASWSEAHLSLATAYSHLNRAADALTELDIAVALSPNDYQANLLRGETLVAQGNLTAGLLNLERAVKIQPASRDARLLLADTYEKLGRAGDALRERAAAQALSAPGKP